jgi:predicted solute-binding protein
MTPAGRQEAGARPACAARIPYLNAAPFYQDWERMEPLSRGLWSATVLPPRQLGMAADAGEVDAGLTAVADLFRLADRFEPLPAPPGSSALGFGVAARERVDSVLLFLRRPEDQPAAPPPAEPLLLTKADLGLLDGADIGLTQESSTSVRLLRLLLEVRHGIRPASATRLGLSPDGPLDQAEGKAAILVIGDLALAWRLRPPRGFRLGMDLAAEWHAWTGLPFVFAQWSVRRSLSAPVKRWFSEFLASSLERSRADFVPLVRDLPPELGPREWLVTYLRQFTYAFGEEEIRGRERFRALLQEHHLLDAGEPQEPAASSA